MLSKNMPFVATVEKGELKHDFKERFKILLAKLEGQRVTVTVKKFHKTRTIPQLRYLRGYVVPITAAFMGYAKQERDQCYAVLKSLFLKGLDNHGREYIKSLSGSSKDPVNTKLMSDFTDHIRDMVAMEYGYEIKDPIKDPSMRLEEVEDLVSEIEKYG